MSIATNICDQKKIENELKKSRLFDYMMSSVNFHYLHLKNQLLSYLDKYMRFGELSVWNLESSYKNFLNRYSKDVKFFLKYNKYPSSSSTNLHKIDVAEYNAALLLSTLLSQHRFEIMKEIKNNFYNPQKTLVVGCGIGLDLEIIKNSCLYIDAFDIKLNEFCKHNHPTINFFEKEFKQSKKILYDCVLLIEILEHLAKPYKLLENVKKSLKKEGRVLLTLAVDMPQFDHLFNFDDFNSFQKKIYSLGFDIIYKKEIPHGKLMNGLETSSNIFLVLQNG